MELERKREREKVEEKKSCGARKIKKKSRIIRKENEKIRGTSGGKKKCEGGGKKGRTSEDNESAGKGRKLKDEK